MMGQPKRAVNMTKRLCLSDRQVEALEDNDEARYFTLAVSQVFLKCGNCGKRHKCATDQTENMRRRTGLDRLIRALDMGDKSNQELAEIGLFLFDFFDERLSEEDWIELIGDLLVGYDIDLIDVVKSFDELFADCDEYNLKDKIIRIGAGAGGG